MRNHGWGAAVVLALGCSGAPSSTVPADAARFPHQDGAISGQDDTARLGVSGRGVPSGTGDASQAGGAGSGDAGAAAPDAGELAAGAGGSAAAGGQGGAGASAGVGGVTPPVAGSAGCADPRYPDDDGDGFGATDSERSCLGRSDSADDCDDSDPDVRPDQTRTFTVARAGGGFDYDCDGDETGDDLLGLCPDTSGAEVVPGSVGWVALCGESSVNGCLSWLYTAPPACGEEGRWKQNAAACPGTNVPKIRGCR